MDPVCNESGRRTGPKSQLFRIPAGGGTPEQIEAGGSLDEFRCPLIGGSNCVLRETEGQKSLIYYTLDLLTGKGASWLVRSGCPTSLQLGLFHPMDRQ